MNSTGTSGDPLQLLFNRLVDDAEFTDGDYSALNDAIGNGDNARSAYVDFFMLDEMLRTEFPALAGVDPKLALESLGIADAELLCRVSPADDKFEAVSIRADAATFERNTPLVSPVLNFVPVGATGWSRLSSASRIAAIAVPVLLTGYFIAMAVYVSLRDRSNHLIGSNGIERGSSIVALVEDATDVQWSKETAPSTDDGIIRQGEPLQIESGFVQLTLRRGTTLLVKGPARWSIDSGNAVSLKHGKLIANVPGKAIGFTVQTTTATLIDLGTEFAVAVEEHGTTEVEVLTGKVELHPTEKRGTSATFSEPITLTAGAARRIEPGENNGPPVVREVAPEQRHLVGELRPVPSNRIFGVSAMASSTERDEFGVNNLVNGSGMHGERHSNKTTNTMWSSAFGKVKGEFVLFDLSRLCNLESMKVWNYNETEFDLFKARGVKQADIFVSKSGKWDPIKEPHEWTLVVDDFKFSMATGTNEYDTPDVIPLGGVEARFVAIVFDECFGVDPRPKFSVGYKSIALSEVQFFGQRIQPNEIRNPGQ